MDLVVLGDPRGVLDCRYPVNGVPPTAWENLGVSERLRHDLCYVSDAGLPQLGGMSNPLRGPYLWVRVAALYRGSRLAQFVEGLRRDPINESLPGEPVDVLSAPGSLPEGTPWSPVDFVTTPTKDPGFVKATLYGQNGTVSDVFSRTMSQSDIEIELWRRYATLPKLTGKTAPPRNFLSPDVRRGAQGLQNSFWPVASQAVRPHGLVARLLGWLRKPAAPETPATPLLDGVEQVGNVEAELAKQIAQFRNGGNRAALEQAVREANTAAGRPTETSIIDRYGNEKTVRFSWVYLVQGEGDRVTVRVVGKVTERLPQGAWGLSHAEWFPEVDLGKVVDRIRSLKNHYLASFGS